MWDHFVTNSIAGQRNLWVLMLTPLEKCWSNSYPFWTACSAGFCFIEETRSGARELLYLLRWRNLFSSQAKWARRVHGCVLCQAKWPPLVADCSLVRLSDQHLCLVVFSCQTKWPALVHDCILLYEFSKLFFTEPIIFLFLNSSIKFLIITQSVCLHFFSIPSNYVSNLVYKLFHAMWDCYFVICCGQYISVHEVHLISA